jgi:hypothetical protein
MRALLDGSKTQTWRIVKGMGRAHGIEQDGSGRWRIR